MARLWYSTKRWVAICVGFGMLADYLVSHEPLFLKLLIGEARILRPESRAMVRVDGVEQPEARCFPMHSAFDGTPTDSLVLWLPDTAASYGRLILIVHRNRRDVGAPNSSDDVYRLCWDRVLVQSNNGARTVSFAAGKSYGVDPHLEVTDSRVTFLMPDNQTELPGKRIEITGWPVARS